MPGFHLMLLPVETGGNLKGRLPDTVNLYGILLRRFVVFCVYQGHNINTKIGFGLQMGKFMFGGKQIVP
jgi:hypothetical protein